MAGCNLESFINGGFIAMALGPFREGSTMAGLDLDRFFFMRSGCFLRSLVRIVMVETFRDLLRLTRACVLSLSTREGSLIGSTD